MPKKSKVHLLDSLLILLNVSSSYSIIPYLLFFQYHRGINTGLIIAIDAIYLLWRFGRHIKIPLNLLFGIYFVLNLINVFSSILTSTGFYMTWLYLMLNTLFFLVLYNCYIEYRKENAYIKSVWLVLRGYIWLCCICLFSVFSVFILMKCGIDIHNNDIGNRMDLFADNVNTLGHTYYFPYWLSVVLVSSSISLKLPFFIEQGTVCGIYFEPHVITFMLFPALFILWAYARTLLKKILWLVLWVLLMLMECSTTNILVFVTCVCVALLFDRVGRYWLVPLFALIILFVFYIGLDNTSFFFIADKLEDAGGSKGYSMNTLEFAFDPQTLMGSNFLNNQYLNEISTGGGRDVGYIPCILNILFLIVFVYKIVSSMFMNSFNRLLGIAVLYFFLHSMKVAMVTYSLSFLVLMIFLITVTTYNKGERNYGIIKESL